MVDDGRAAHSALADFETTGRVWIGARKASGPFVKLRARADDLSITSPIVSISFSPREVVAFEPLRGVFGYGGFRIVHTVDGRDVQFWCRDVETVRRRIAATGFAPHGVAGAGPDPARRARHDEEARGSRRGLFRLFAILGVGLVALFGAIVVGVVFGAKDGDFYDATWTTVQADPRVVAMTGTPVTSTTPSGSVELVGSDGTASLRYEVSGPKGRGTVEAAGTKTGGRWVTDRLVFRPEGNEATSIDLAAGRR